MNDQQVQQGRVTKIVRVPFASSSAGASHSDHVDGYGIIRSELGTEVFFVGAVVAEQTFVELEIGDTVCFELEPGPLSRASRVLVQPEIDNSQPSFVRETA